MSDAAPAPPPKRRRLDAFEAVFQVAQLTVKRSFKGKRALIALLVVALPAALGILIRSCGANADNQEGFFWGMLYTYHFGIAVPFVALLFATAFPWPEAEEGTLTYWFTSPVPRWTVLAGRYAAALVVGATVLSIGVLAIGLPLATPPAAETGRVMRAAIASTLLAFPAYVALFQFVATVFRKSLSFGVVFIFLENFVSVLPGTALVQSTLIFYIRSQLLPSVPEASRRRYMSLLHVVEPATNATAVATFAGVTILALGLSLLVVQVIEYRGRTSQPG